MIYAAMSAGGSSRADSTCDEAGEEAVRNVSMILLDTSGKNACCFPTFTAH